MVGELFHCKSLWFLLHKVHCFINILGTNKTDNLVCEIMIISHGKIIAFQAITIIVSGHLILVENLWFI